MRCFLTGDDPEPGPRAPQPPVVTTESAITAHARPTRLRIVSGNGLKP